MAVFDDVADERKRQDEKWGVQSHQNGTGGHWSVEMDLAKLRCEQAEKGKGGPTWVHILDEEVLEAFCETDPVKLRVELIQVAAVAVAWVENLDRLEAARALEKPKVDLYPFTYGPFGRPTKAVGSVEAEAS